VGSLTALPGTSVSPAADAVRALFLEARRRRRRRWLARTAAVLAAATVVAVCAVIWLPGGLTGPPAARGPVSGPAGRASGPFWRARVVCRVATAGVPEAYGTWNIRSSGHNQSLSFSSVTLAAGPEPARPYSGTERIVDRQIYVLDRPHGRPEWVHEPIQPYIHVKIIDPRKLLHFLAPFARFQATGYQMIGGVRLKVLRATDPYHLKLRGLLPEVRTSGQPLGSLELWVDPHGVVHRMAFTFRARGRILLSTPVSEKALATYGRAELADTNLLSRYVRPGSRVSKRRVEMAFRRANQALRGAFPVRTGYEVTSTTVMFTAIGQPQLITAPPNAVSAH
jgi:hypothetical protein